MRPPEAVIAKVADQVKAEDIDAGAWLATARLRLGSRDLRVRATLRFEGPPPRVREHYHRHLLRELRRACGTAGRCTLDNTHVDPVRGPPRTRLTFGPEARRAAEDVSAAARSVGKRDQAGLGR